MWLNSKNFNEIEIPKDFNEFKNYIYNFLDTKKSKTRAFLWADYEVKIEIKDSPTFAFSPSEKLVIIPEKWLKKFHDKLVLWNNENKKSKYIHSFKDFEFGYFHELSHFKDLIKETEISWKKSMIKILKYVWNQKIKFWSDRIIPISSWMHDICNYLDDIIVNKEVEVDIWAWFTKKDINGLYKYNMFADLIEQKWWDYTEWKNWREYVWEWKWTHIVNETNSVDYSDINDSKAFPYFLLRSFMVPDQNIKLPKNVDNIIWKPIWWKTTITRAINTMIEHFNELKQNWTDEEKVRLQKLSTEYQTHISFLKNILDNSNKIEGLLSKAIKQTNTSNILNKSNINIVNIIKLFMVSSGKTSDNHILWINPALRYEIYKIFFMPLQKSFILMDLLKQDIKEDDNKLKWNKWEKWEWEEWEKWDESEKWEWELEKNDEQNEWKKQEKQKKSQENNSAGQNIHESPDIAEKIKILEELEKEQEKQEKEKLIKKQVEKSKYNTKSVLDWSWISDEWIKTLNSITTKYKDWIEELVIFFIKELEKIDTIQDIEEIGAKKWRLNTNKLREYIAKDPSYSDIHNQKLYDKNIINEIIGKNFKKIDLTLALDISGSTWWFRWPDGMMNIISTILYISMKHLEQHIANLIWDPNYNIWVEYILYWDWKPYSSFEEDYKYKNSPETVRMWELNWKIISLGWWTNDTTAWESIANEFDERLKKQTEYTQEIKDNKRKPIVLQIADTDVSENWVESLIQTFKNNLDNEKIVESLPIKRIILWNVDLQEISEQEYIKIQETWNKWNWDIYKDDKTWKLIRKQIWIKQKKEILWQIKELFNWFFSDIKN